MSLFEWITIQSWAILPDCFNRVLQQTENWQSVTEAILKKSDHLLSHTQCIQLRDNIAVLPITGLILPYENLFSQLLGATTLDTLACDFQQALDNPTISAIIFNIDSPGGTVTGVHECAEMIYQARGKKPITAYISGLGASAAYWIASSADEIVLDATASVGSIGVLSIHTDDKAQKAKNGLVQTHIVSSQSPHKRLDIATEEGRADMQAQVDAIADVFVENVARNRKVSIDTVLSDFGQGSLCVGIHAVKKNMADRIGSLEQLIQEKTAIVPAPPFYQPQREKTMTEILNSVSAPQITADTLAQQHPDVVQTLRVDAAQQERERIQAVEAQSMPGHEVLIQALKFDGKTSGAEAAMQVLAAEKRRHTEKFTEMKAHAPSPLPIAMNVNEEPSFKQHQKNTLSALEKWQANWQQDSSLQSEFGCFETYLAFMQAEKNGQVNLLSKQ
jgi:capsid assembly protease